MAPPYPTQHPTLPLDSPASASSSTLITPLPLDPLARKGLSPDLFAPPRAPRQTTTRKRPSLSLSLGSGGGGGGGPGSEQGRMSGKGFIEPHHGHLPRRARTTVRKGAASANKEGAARVASTPTPNTGRTRVLPHLQSPTDTSTVAASPLQDGDAPLQTGMTTLTEPPTSSAFPPTSTSTLTPAPWSHSAHSAQSPTTPTPIPTTPTPTPNANTIPTRSTIMSNTIDAVLASASASASDPSMPTSHHHPALGLTMNLAALANSGKPLPSASHQNSARPAPLPIPPIPLLSLEQEQGVPTPTPAPLGTPGPGVNLPRRHQRRGRSASPAPALALSQTPAPAPVRTPLPARTPLPTTSRRRVHSASRTRELTASDLARMHRAEDARRRAERREAKRRRACVQAVGSGSRVEVGFLDEDEGGVGWFEEGGEKQGNEKEGGPDAEAREGKDKPDGKGRAPYVLVKVLGVSCSVSKARSKSGSGPSASSSSSESSESDSEHDAEINSNTDSGPCRPTSLRLPLPTTRTAYVDGSAALSSKQMREACTFIAGWLLSGEEEEENGRTARRLRLRVRILAPRWRPEEAMGVALCYLAGLGRGAGEKGGEVIASSPRVNDLRYFAASSESSQARESGALHSPASLPSPSSNGSTPTPAPSEPLLPIPDVYAYSPLHLLAMRLLDDDAAWIGRGALYEARTRAGNKEEEDVFGSVPARGTGLTGEDGEADAGSADDTLGSSTHGELDMDLETRGRGRGRKHAREGAEWRWRWSASAPAPVLSPSAGRGPSLAIGKEERVATRRAETRERRRDERVGRRKKEVAEEEVDEEEWKGLQDAWRGVLSFGGLARLAEVVYGDGWVVREMGVL